MNAAASLARANRRIGLVTALLAVGMIGLAYAAVPLYRLFCQVTGFGGTTGVAVAAPTADRLAAVAGRTVKIRFDANVAPGLAWRFKPKATEISVPIGEKRLAFYQAANTGDSPITGRAVFNVSPDVAGRYFIKIDCFCFTEQTLAAGETVDMPVTFYVDPAIIDDPVAKKLDEITLSYTFYPVEKPTGPVAALDKPATVTLSGATNRNSIRDRG